MAEYNGKDFFSKLDGIMESHLNEDDSKIDSKVLNHDDLHTAFSKQIVKLNQVITKTNHTILDAKAKNLYWFIQSYENSFKIDIENINNESLNFFNGFKVDFHLHYFPTVIDDVLNTIDSRLQVYKSLVSISKRDFIQQKVYENLFKTIDGLKDELYNSSNILFLLSSFDIELFDLKMLLDKHRIDEIGIQQVQDQIKTIYNLYLKLLDESVKYMHTLYKVQLLEKKDLFDGVIYKLKFEDE